MMPDPVPTYFGFRFVMWWLWSNAITGLMILQAAFTALTLDPTLVPHETFHWILLGNSVLCAIVAQVKLTNPTPQEKQQCANPTPRL